jgi:hypothetical protein
MPAGTVAVGVGVGVDVVDGEVVVGEGDAEDVLAELLHAVKSSMTAIAVVRRLANLIVITTCLVGLALDTTIPRI